MNIGYIVEETNRAGSLRCRLFTPCPWHAIAEWLVKTYRPMAFPPGSRPGDGELSLDISGKSVVVDAALLSVAATFKSNGEEVRSVTIRTEILTSEFEAHYIAGSARAYLDEDYNSAIMKMRDKLIKYCSDNLDVGYVLSQFASNDHLHPFWKPRLFNRVRGLSF